MSTISNLTPDVIVSHKISEGVFAEVFVGESSGSPVAIKIPKISRKGSLRAAEREIRALQRLKHNNICQFLGTCETQTSSLSLVTELLDGDLRQLILQPSLLPNYEERLNWMLQVARAVAYMHERDFVHQDIKLENILFRNLPDGSTEIKICDFGMTRRMLGSSFSNPTRIGTALYMSPEVLEASEFLTHKIDVYSFGLALWELLAAQKAFADQTKFAHFRNVILAGVRPLIPSWCSNRLRELMQFCWAHDPEDRPSMSQVVLELEEILKENDVVAPAYKSIQERIVHLSPDRPSSPSLCFEVMPTELA